MEEEQNQSQTNEEPIIESSQPTGSMLMRKKPNMIWMLATIVFLSATLLELYSLTTSPIPTPSQMTSALVANGYPLLTLNTTALNDQYNHTVSSRGYYEIGAVVVAIVLAGMMGKNLYLYFRK